MERVNKILNDSRFNNILSELIKTEENRIFCRHTWQHFVDTARICYILVLEDKINNKNIEDTRKIGKEIVYAAGILHDIGRLEQYKNNRDHAEVGAELSKKILFDAGFTCEEVKIITDAIGEHRKLPDKPTYLGEKLYKADKLSRPCYNCNASQECHKKENIKQKLFQY